MMPMMPRMTTLGVVGELEDVAHPFGERGGHRLRHAEDVADHPDGDLLGVLGGGVAAAAREEPVDELHGTASRVNTSYSSTRCGLIVGRISRRVHVCSGGSALIGGTPDDRIGAARSGARPCGRRDDAMPFPDGKFSMSWAISVTSA